MDSYMSTIGLEKFDLELDSVPQIYLPGKQVAGHVTLTTKKPLHFQTIIVECRGEANTHKTKSKLRDSAPFSLVYSGQDVIFEDETTLLTGPQTAASSEDPPQVELNPGTYKMPFYFTLPSGCPGSFEGTFGSIRYYLRASINNTNGHIMHMIKQPFTVINVVDLNNDVDDVGRLSTNAAVSMGKAGQITCKVSMKQKGYVPGESVDVKFEVNNDSSKVINGFNCQLQQIVTYVGLKDKSEKVSTWQETRIVQQISKKSKVPSHKPTNLTWQLFKMPALSPTLLNECKLISVQYGLVISTSDLDPNLAIFVPIVVGNIPLEANIEPLKLSRDLAFGATPPDQVSVAMPLVPLTEKHNDLPVPYYVPCFYGSADIRDQQQDAIIFGAPLPFTPWNVTYDWSIQAKDISDRLAKEAALRDLESKQREQENKKDKKSVRGKSVGRTSEYVVNGESPNDKRKSLFKKKNTTVSKSTVSLVSTSPHVGNSLDKATQTE